MNDNLEQQGTGMHSARPSRSRVPIPSWFGSVGFHIVTLAVVLIMLNMSPERKQSPGVQTAEVGVALYDGNPQDQEQFEYEGQDSEGGAAPEAAVTADSVAPTLDSIFSEPTAAPSIAPPELPDFASIGPSMLEEIAGGGAIPAISGPGGIGVGDNGKTTVGFNGTSGTGSSFVYVIDRSGSMGGSAEAAIRAAKEELTRSLEAIKPTHQFQIVFFNQDAQVFNPAGGRRLAYGTDQNKRIAQNFMASIIPDGGTAHEAALMQAIGLSPDVIFFLSDAGEPQMTVAQLVRIRRAAAGITINAIEYGRGPSSGTYNFLSRLASENGGQHAYVDITPFIRR